MHSYLLTSLFLTALCLAGLWLVPRHRTPALLSAMLGIPGAAYSLVFVPTYWNPVRILALPIGIEDVLFSFANGGLVWLLVAVWTPGIRVSIDAATVAKRWLAVTAAFTLLLVVIARAGVPVMHAGLVGAAVILGAMLWLCPAYWPLAVRGAIAFTILYGAVLFGNLHIWPGTLSQWDTRVLSGIVFLGAPVEEMVWALAYGALYPVVMAFFLDARMTQRR